MSKEPELHILYNNAYALLDFVGSVGPLTRLLRSRRGVMGPPIDQLTEDGYDMQWGTNVLGHYYFTMLLIPALVAGVKSSPDHHARVVTTASSGAYLDTIHWETLKDTPERKKRSTDYQYMQSKFVRCAV